MSDAKFKPVCKDGLQIPGLYTSDICRVERDQDDLWVADVPMRSIGKSAFMEFRSLAMGGQWVRIGRFKTRAGALVAAERLQSGEIVFDSAVSRNGHTPVTLVSFSSVVEEIRKFQ